jgi:uncharacterized surface protein with fasciclin (FAS1) repeats
MLNHFKSLVLAGLAFGGLFSVTVAEAAPTQSIVEIAVSDPDLSTLVKALTDANLVKTLEGPGPFTVFAPTNSAFAKLPTGLLDYLLDNPPILGKVLLYHVAAGSAPLTSAPITTVEGGLVFPSFSYAPNGVTVTVGNSHVIAHPISATNGVIYLIDSVLMPQF